MKTKIVILLIMSAIALRAETNFKWEPVIQQTTFYFASDRVTAAGLGIGAGVRIIWKENVLFQSDANWLWANGNAVPVRFALGYQKSGRWSPAVFGTFNLLFGQRTEILSKTGKRPAWPAWSSGLRAAPLRFENQNGYASLFEFGYGFGPDNGISLECTILSIGVNW